MCGGVGVRLQELRRVIGVLSAKWAQVSAVPGSGMRPAGSGAVLR